MNPTTTQAILWTLLLSLQDESQTDLVDLSSDSDEEDSQPSSSGSRSPPLSDNDRPVSNVQVNRSPRLPDNEEPMPNVRGRKSPPLPDKDNPTSNIQGRKSPPLPDSTSKSENRSVVPQYPSAEARHIVSNATASSQCSFNSDSEDDADVPKYPVTSATISAGPRRLVSCGKVLTGSRRLVSIAAVSAGPRNPVNNATVSSQCSFSSDSEDDSQDSLG